MNIDWKKLGIVVVAFVFIVGISCILMYLEKQRMLENSELTIVGSCMGTYYDIRIILPGIEKNRLDAYALKNKIDRKILEIEEKTSIYRDNSEISNINNSKTLDWIKISEDVYKLIQEAERVSIATEGIYDITVGNLIKLWNFGPGRTSVVDKIPSKSEIKETLKTVGYNKIRLKKEGEDFYLKKLNKNLHIDLSSIAKGYGLDKVSQLLLDLSYQNHKVEIGGEVIVRGKNLNSQDWRIGIERPNLKMKSLPRISIFNKAVATSGSYRNYYKYGGKVYTHIMDPIRGYPIENKVISVTVIADECSHADALSTALFSVGVEKGLKLADKLSIPVYYVYIDEDKKIVETWNKEFEPYIIEGSN